MKRLEEVETVHWLVRGRVQGVSFRAFVRRRARQLQAHGWVRNLSSGEVEIVARGSANSLTALRQAAQSGPMMARVDDVEELLSTESNEITKDYPTDFEIRATAQAPEFETQEKAP